MNCLPIDKIDFLLGIPCKDLNVSQDSHLQLYFPLKKYGYTLEKVLNNENRWQTKVVCSILNRDFRHYVSTTYANRSDYLKLIETTTFLRCCNKLSPKITEIYPKINTVVCEYIGEFLSTYLINSPSDIALNLNSVFEYLKEINSINPNNKRFVIPPIIKTSLGISKGLGCDFEFLPRVRAILPQLEDSDNKFTYGYGIEDPHIWNFRIVRTSDKICVLTTDFDYFSDRINCFWELGYFYATLRWFKKISFPLTYKAEKILFSLIQKQDLKSEFMFWLGVLSSYCGYKDSLYNFIANGEMVKLKGQYRTIEQLDRKVSYLAEKLLLGVNPPLNFYNNENNRDERNSC